ncbi:MAG TPA: hypothetical protein DEV98_09385 [Clostridiales bacterium]|nr:hypothetical protein [Clostridiales bacterium]
MATPPREEALQRAALAHIRRGQGFQQCQFPVPDRIASDFPGGNAVGAPFFGAPCLYDHMDIVGDIGCQQFV